MIPDYLEPSMDGLAGPNDIIGAVERVGAVAELRPASVPVALTLRVESLDHFVFCREKHLRRLQTEYLNRDNAERPLRGIGNVSLTKDAKKPKPEKGRVICRKRHGGLIRHYHRSAA